VKGFWREKSWLGRAVRGLRLDRNPLRRGTDRLETCLLAGALVAAAAVTPFAAQAAARASYASGLHVRQEQLATRHEVRAVLTRGAVAPGGYMLAAEVPAPATWMSVGGTHRSGEVPAEAGSRAGTAVVVWTDGSGYLVSPPLELSEVAGGADTALVGAVAGAAVAYLAVAAAIRYLLNRRRMAAWDADWLATARAWNRPSWS
jgi:hypothetical protein